MFHKNNALMSVNNLGYGLFDFQNSNNQLTTLRGKVVDGSTNKPLSAAHVYYIKNNQEVGVITNAQGEYELLATPNDVIIISFLGYNVIEALASEIQSIEYLHPEAEQLDEVLVTAPKETPKNNTYLYWGFGILAAVVIGRSIGQMQNNG